MFYGCDIDQLRDHGQRTASAAGTLQTVLEQASATAIGVHWIGPDTDRFHLDLQILTQDGRRLAERLDLLAAELEGHADEQDSASTPDAFGPSRPQTPPTTLDPELAAELDELLEEAIHDGGLGDLNGNSADINRLTEKLASMTPEERAAFVATLTDDELAALNDALNADGSGLLGLGGNTDQSRRALLDQLLKDADPADVERLGDAFDLLNPDQRGGGDAAQGTYSVEPNGTVSPPGEVVPDDASWKDVNQGDYGDCVSMATLGMMMQQNPNWAAEHVVDNGNGTVTVTLYDENGDPEPITMPKELPAVDGNAVSAGRDALATDPNAPTWPAYVERALAMQMGEGYDGIEGWGSPDVGPRLTGMQVETLPPNDPDAAFAAAERGEPVIVGTAVSDPPEPAPDGWVGGHGFWVDGVGRNAAGEEVILLRNPHGPHTGVVEMTREQYRVYTSSAEVHHD